MTSASEMPESQQPLISFITVNWRSADAIHHLLESLADAVTVAYEAIVVNNDATERELLESTCAHYPQVTLVHCETNVGFAAGCNRGSRIACGRHFIFVNPDVRIQRFPHHIIPELDRRFRSRVVYGTILNASGRPALGSVRRLPTYRRLLISSMGLDRIVASWRGAGLFYGCETTLPDYGEVEQPSGAFFGVTRATFDELGGFDERFFVFFEEVDLSLRATKAGVPVVIVRGLLVEHEGGHSTRADRTIAIGLRWRSFRAFYKKHAQHLRLPHPGLLITLEAIRFKLQRLIPTRGWRFSLTRALRIALASTIHGLL